MGCRLFRGIEKTQFPKTKLSLAAKERLQYM